MSCRGGSDDAGLERLAQPRPQPSPLAVDVLVEAGALQPRGATDLDHLLDDRLGRVRLVLAARVLDTLPAGDGDLVHQLEVQLVRQLQRRRRVTGLRTRALDARRFDPFAEHRERLVDERADDAAGEEAAAVIDDDRGFADGQRVVEHPGQRFVRGLLALDDFHQRHLVTGEKKWIPMKSSCRFTPVARPVIGSVEVFEPSSALGSTMSNT